MRVRVCVESLTDITNRGENDNTTQPKYTTTLESSNLFVDSVITMEAGGGGGSIRQFRSIVKWREGSANVQ